MNQIRAEYSSIESMVRNAVDSTPVHDIHTHLYDPAFGELLLWGIDDLLVYHYLVAEAFRYLDMEYETFGALSKSRQAEVIWQHLFIEHSPISESCRGVLTTLQALGLDVRQRDLPALRKWFASQSPDAYISRCLELAGVASVCMTNSPFDDLERPVWEKGVRRDERFRSALRIDPLLLSWDSTAAKLRDWGYQTSTELNPKTIEEIRRFLREWTKKIGAGYLMVSLSPAFNFPSSETCSQLLAQAVLPHCEEFGLPMALMMGVTRQVNPHLGLAGDGVGLSQLGALRELCASFPRNKFLVTVLSRENQHELCVLARKFRNLHIFGCWWFTNIPSLIGEITRMRLELLGCSMTPQHSDARVLDQLIYKWRHSREIISQVLVEKYSDLARTGWVISESEVRRDATDLLGGAFAKFCGLNCRT